MKTNSFFSATAPTGTCTQSRRGGRTGRRGGGREEEGRRGRGGGEDGGSRERGGVDEGGELLERKNAVEGK